MKPRTSIGQDSHKFLTTESTKPCIIGGVPFENTPGFDANSDGDIVLHAICNAISSLSGTLILGAIADELCLNQGITNSEVYVKEAMKTLKKITITHVAITIEAKRPKFKDKIEEMRKNIARILNINTEDVGITATSGESLTGFGRGDGAQCFCIVTAVEK